MSSHPSPPVKLVLCDNEGVGRISVDLEPFFEFSFWMAEELQDLVFKYRDFSRGERGRGRVTARP